MTTALLRVVAEHGLAEAKLARVAEEAGTSVGLVQSYFRSKSELLRFAVEHLCRRADERVDQVKPIRPLRDAVRGLAETLLPLDEERRTEAAVWLAFLPVTLTDPALAELHRSAIDHQLAGIGRALAASQTLGELSRDVDVRREAMALTAFLDGLANHMLTRPEVYDARAARRMVRTYVDRLYEADSS